MPEVFGREPGTRGLGPVNGRGISIDVGVEADMGAGRDIEGAGRDVEGVETATEGAGTILEGAETGIDEVGVGEILLLFGMRADRWNASG